MGASSFGTTGAAGLHYVPRKPLGNEVTLARPGGCLLERRAAPGSR